MLKVVDLWVVTWLFVMAAQAPAAAQAQSRASDSLADHRQLIKEASRLIPNFHEVSPGLYRGGNPVDAEQGEKALALLARLGVVNDIDLQGGDIDGSFLGWMAEQTEPGEAPEMIAKEEELAGKNGLTFTHLPLNSHAAVSSDEDSAIHQALTLMADAEAHPIFIHCQHGVDRTGLVVALHRVMQESWTVDQAHQEWADLGHGFESRLVTGDLDSYFEALTEGLK